jgi:hypothetical protein
VYDPGLFLVHDIEVISWDGSAKGATGCQASAVTRSVIVILGQEGEHIVELDEERKAAVVSNSMAVGPLQRPWRSTADR